MIYVHLWLEVIFIRPQMNAVHLAPPLRRPMKSDRFLDLARIIGTPADECVDLDQCRRLTRSLLWRRHIDALQFHLIG